MFAFIFRFQDFFLLLLFGYLRNVRLYNKEMRETRNERTYLLLQNVEFLSSPVYAR